MIRFRLAAAASCFAAGLLAAAVPAQADTIAAAGAAATQPAVAGQTDLRQQQRAEEPVYCARIEVPARRVRPRICKTRAQWEREYGGLPTR